MTYLRSLCSRKSAAAILALLVANYSLAQAPAKLDPPVKPTVTGKFVGNGKNAAIKYVTVEEHERFSDQDAITLIFTEKDPAAVKKPSFDAMFGKLGSSLILNVHYDGGIFGCQVAHSAHQKQGFSSIGEIKMVDFKIAGGNVSGHVSTGKELDAFGEKWEVDLTFAAPMPAKLRNAPTAPPAKPVASELEKPDKPESPKPAAAGPLIAARKLPIPKDATDVEFKTLVKHIQFSSARPVAEVTKEFSASLKQQGWKDSAGSLVGPKSSILRREQGDAKLTIFVQPAATGSVVKIMTEGLDWSGAEGGALPASKKPGNPSATDAEGEAQKAIKDAEKALQDALKGLPK